MSTPPLPASFLAVETKPCPNCGISGHGKGEAIDYQCTPPLRTYRCGVCGHLLATEPDPEATTGQPLPFSVPVGLEGWTWNTTEVAGAVVFRGSLHAAFAVGNPCSEGFNQLAEVLFSAIDKYESLAAECALRIRMLTEDYNQVKEIQAGSKGQPFYGLSISEIFKQFGEDASCSE